MKNLAKRIAHSLVGVLEHLLGFHVPYELPLRTKWALLTGTYERETAAYIRARVRGGVAIDVGAHVGYYTRLLSPLVEKVYAFEPDPRNYAFLVRNTKRLGNVVAFPFAVSDKEGEQPFYVVPDSTFRHSLINTGEGERTMVHTIALDTFPELVGEKVSVVKIDVEGHEAEVLAGMRHLREAYHPLVIAEMPEHEGDQAVSAAIGKKGVRNYVV